MDRLTPKATDGQLQTADAAFQLAQKQSPAGQASVVVGLGLHHRRRPHSGLDGRTPDDVSPNLQGYRSNIPKICPTAWVHFYAH